MLKGLYRMLSWLLSLFNAPPLKSMTVTQKAGRVLILTGTLIIAVHGAIAPKSDRLPRHFRVVGVTVP
jgi:hypothetical protein